MGQRFGINLLRTIMIHYLKNIYMNVQMVLNESTHRRKAISSNLD
jgi:hypothetical protein